MDIPTQLDELRRTWRPPPGLERCRPRAVRWTGTGKAVLGIAGFLFAGAVAAGVVLGIAASRDAERARLLREESVAVEGTVTRLWRSRGDERQYWVAYRYAASGREYHGTARLSLPSWRLLAVGAPVPVHYVRSKPEISRPFRDTWSGMPPWVPFAAAFALAGAGLLAILAPFRQRRLLREGRAAPAVVTRLESVHHRGRAARSEVRIHYAFALLSGATAYGKGGPMKNPPDVGSAIAVIYQPDDPRRNAPYPLPFARLK